MALLPDISLLSEMLLLPEMPFPTNGGSLDRLISPKPHLELERWKSIVWINWNSGSPSYLLLRHRIIYLAKFETFGKKLGWDILISGKWTSIRHIEEETKNVIDSLQTGSMWKSGHLMKAKWWSGNGNAISAREKTFPRQSRIRPRILTNTRSAKSSNPPQNLPLFSLTTTSASSGPQRGPQVVLEEEGPEVVEGGVNHNHDHNHNHHNHNHNHHLEGVGPEVVEGFVEVETTVDEKAVGVGVVWGCLQRIILRIINV